MDYTETMQAAFYDELQKIAEANGGQLPFFVKEAGFWSNALSSAKPVAAAAENFRGGPGMLQRYGQSLMEGGKGLMVPKLIGAGKWGPAGPISRTVGEVAHSVGHHYANKSTLQHVINPLGAVLGGSAEGLTRAAGRELHTAGGNIANRMGSAMQSAGSGLQRAAKPIGKAGEIAGLAGIGGAVHAPVSLAGMVGHHLVGGAAAAAPAVGEAVHSLGAVGAHAAHDVVGNAAHSLADRAKNFVHRGLQARPQPLIPRTV